MQTMYLLHMREIHIQRQPKLTCFLANTQRTENAVPILTEHIFLKLRFIINIMLCYILTSSLNNQVRKQTGTTIST